MVPMTDVPAAFSLAFGGARPTRLARAPGRVNLIGEHVDYCGLSVLPMAIQREVRLAFRPRPDSLVRVANVLAGLIAYSWQPKKPHLIFTRQEANALSLC